VSFSPPPGVVTFAAPTSKLTYTASQATSAQVQSGFTATITATPSNALSTPGSSILTLAKPAFTEFGISTSNSGAENIEVGPDGAIWFSEPNVDQIGRIATNAAAGSHPADFGGLVMGASPRVLVNGSDHNIWFTEFGAGVAKMNPSTHAVTEYPTPSGVGDNPYGMVNGPDGDIWFTENCSMHSNVGKFNPATPTMITEYTAAMSSAPQSITVGSDNNLWFTEPSLSPNAIAKMTTAGVRTDYTAAPDDGIYEGGILNGPDGAIWFSECNHSGNNIGRIATSGSPLTYYALPSAASEPTVLVTGPDGAIWFVEQNNNAIGRITPTTHDFAEFPIPTMNAGAFGITLGPDGALWFTEADGNKIGKLQ
jgi:streptogramin lyase